MFYCLDVHQGCQNSVYLKIMPLDVVTLMVFVPSLKAIATKSTNPNKWNTVSLNFSLQNIKKKQQQQTNNTI